LRAPRIYLPGPLHCGACVALPRDRERYLCRVLRLQQGAPLLVFNGAGGHYQASLELAEGQAARLRIAAHHHSDSESPLAITLLQGISRGERMEFTLRKATELGVSAIVPLFTARCEVRLKGDRLAKRMAHWQGIIISACEQSGRDRLPTLHPPRALDTIERPPDGSGLLLDPLAGHGMASLPRPNGAVSLLIGPEGGLSETEISQARRHGFAGVRLGPRILRTETAPLAALAAMQVLWGDL